MIIGVIGLGTVGFGTVDILTKEKERLEGAIKRRENLLSNENYVNKAPKNIVDLDRENLEKDKKELEIIMDKLNN